MTRLRMHVVQMCRAADRMVWCSCGFGRETEGFPVSTVTHGTRGSSRPPLIHPLA